MEPETESDTGQSDELVLKSEPANSNDPLVAEWKGGSLYLSQIDRFVGAHVWEKMSTIQDATQAADLLARERERVVNTLVGNYLLLLEAHARNLSLTDAQQDDLLRSAKSRFKNEEEYKKYLSQSNQTESDLVSILYNIELGKLCVENQQQKIAESLTQDKMRAYYDKHIDLFTPPHRTHLNCVEIYAEEKDRTWDEAKALAASLYEDVKQKVESLNTLEEKRNVIRECARKYSDAWSGKYNGGYITLYHNAQTEEAFSQAFLDAAKNTPPGELSNLFRTGKGYAFLLVKEQFPSVRQKFDSEAMQQMLPNMMIKEDMDAWREELKRLYELKTYDENYYLPPDEHYFPSAAESAGPSPDGS